MSTRAAQILLALNNQIKHAPQENPKSLSNISQETTPATNKKQTKENISSEITSQILPENENINQTPNFSQQIKYEQTHESPQWLVEMLSKQIGGQVSEKMSELVQGLLHKRQKNTYGSLIGNNNNYLQAMLENKRMHDQFNINAITNLMSARANKVQADLQRGKLQVTVNQEPKIVSKRQIDLLQKFQLQRMIKIKDGELRSKLDILNEKMSSFQAVQSWQGPSTSQKQIQEQLRKKVAQNMDAATYSLDSQKTKIARDYVRYMNQQRKLFEKRRKQREQRYEQYQAERESQMNEAMQMKDLAKKQEIVQRIEQRRQKRQEEEKEIQQKQQQVKSFLAEFHQKYPLFKQKQKQFEQKFIKPEQKLIQQKLSQIRQNRKSMSMSEINKHQQIYIKKLENDQAKRQEQFKLILKSRKAEYGKKLYYRGSAHRRIGQMTKQDQLRSYSMRQASKVKALRMKEYGDAIHTKHQPKIDQDKKQQLMNLIQVDIMKKKKAKRVYKQFIDQTTKQVKLVLQYEALPQKDSKSVGNRYFDEAKKFMKKKPKQGQNQILEPQQQKSPKSQANSLALLHNSNTQPQSKLKSIWHVRAKQLSQFAGSNIEDAKNFEFVKHNIENLDQKAAAKEQMMKKLDFPMQQHIQQKGNLDRFYLQSIKQKIKLLQ